MVVSVGLHFWDQSGPLSEQGHKYTEAQNEASGKETEAITWSVFYLCLCACTLEHFSDCLSCFFSTCYILKTPLRHNGVQRIRFFFNNLRTLESRLPTLCNGVSFFYGPHKWNCSIPGCEVRRGKANCIHPPLQTARHSDIALQGVERHPQPCAGTAGGLKTCSPNTVQGTVTAQLSVRKKQGWSAILQNKCACPPILFRGLCGFLRVSGFVGPFAPPLSLTCDISLNTLFPSLLWKQDQVKCLPWKAFASHLRDH